MSFVETGVKRSGTHWFQATAQHTCSFSVTWIPTEPFVISQNRRCSSFLLKKKKKKSLPNSNNRFMTQTPEMHTKEFCRQAVYIQNQTPHRGLLLERKQRLHWQKTAPTHRDGPIYGWVTFLGSSVCSLSPINSFCSEKRSLKGIEVSSHLLFLLISEVRLTPESTGQNYQGWPVLAASQLSGVKSGLESLPSSAHLPSWGMKNKKFHCPSRTKC